MPPSCFRAAADARPRPQNSIHSRQQTQRRQTQRGGPDRCAYLGSFRPSRACPPVGSFTHHWPDSLLPANSLQTLGNLNIASTPPATLAALSPSPRLLPVPIVRCVCLVCFLLLGGRLCVFEAIYILLGVALLSALCLSLCRQSLEEEETSSEA